LLVSPVMAEASAHEETAKSGVPPLQLAFATSLDDPRLEADLLPRAMSKRALLACGAGCSVLSLSRRYPDVAYTALEPDPRVLEHVRAKIAAAEARDTKALNLEDPSPTGLNQSGRFEQIFAGFRARLYANVAPREDWLGFFRRDRDLTELDGLLRKWLRDPGWKSAIEASFGDDLRAVLGTEAQRQLATTWPEYMQKVLERALRRDAAPENPFLSLALLGQYNEDREPYYVRNGGPFAIDFVHGTVADVPDLGVFDLVSLGSGLDLASDDEVRATVAVLGKAMRPGAVVFVRQLASTRSLRPLFQPDFWFDDRIGRRFSERDRSIFHSRFEVAVKR
jgi:S-adenosylmethionine-diacylglycerol 3-amino-3-carboxypropyl transferase